ncbi:MAG: hypothetical protein K8S15_04720 [Candidatus Aegiribacteria sp.]|nr:hypothetical protein [Candidatus Aegiribacteria sp.]
MTICTCIVFVLSGIFSVDYLPPPDGIGSEILPLNTRSFGMGGVCVGVPDSTGFSMLNPAASAWTLDGGVCFGGKYSEGDVKAWDNQLGFPMISAFVPLPGGIVISGAIDGRSRLDSELQEAVSDNYTGEFTWSGGIVETYTGISISANDWLALSFGGRCSFGNILSDITLIPSDSISPIPINSVYRDDARLRMAWGGTFGILVNTDRFGLGFSISTDRKGTLEVNRDFLTSGSPDSSSSIYSLPGEITAGISFRPVERLLLGVDIYSRKVLNILGSCTDDGSVYSVGAEVNVGNGLLTRCGFSYMDGLWRDGAETFSAGAGYSFSEGRAGIDIAAGYQYWRGVQDRFQEETVLCVSLWATEKWLGR